MLTQIIREIRRLPNQGDKICICQTHFCISNGSKVIVYGDIKEEDGLAIPLIGHHAKVSSMKFVSDEASGELILFTAASDYLIAWDLEDVMIAFTNGEQVCGEVIDEMNCPPHHISSHKQLISLTSHAGVFIYSTATRQMVMDVKVSNVSCSELLSDNLLLTTTSNGSFQVRDINNDGVVLSTYLATSTGHGVNFVSAASCGSYFAVGSSNSVIHEFLVYDDGLFRENFNLDVDQAIIRYQHRHKLAMTSSTTRGQILAVAYVDWFDTSSSSLTSSASPSNGNHRGVVMASEQAIFHVDCLNNETTLHPYTTTFDSDDVSQIGAVCVDEAVFSPHYHPRKMWLLASFIFDMKYVLYELKCNDHLNIQPISFISKEPLMANSPLKIKIKCDGKKKVKCKEVDKPLTFRTTIKSSGYSSSSGRRKMFTPVTTTKKKSLNKGAKLRGDMLKLPPISHMSGGEDKWLKGLRHQSHALLSSKPSIVTCISPSPQGELLACSLNNSTIQTCNLPLPTHINKFNNLTGHEGSVSWLSWSNHNNLLLSSSTDNHVKMWKPECSKPVLDINLTCHLPNKVVKGEVICSQFYYIDNFVILPFANSLLMFTYQLHNGPKNDVKRYLNVGKQRLVGSWPMSDAHNITWVAAPNNYYSYVVLRSGSNKNIETLDMNADGKIVQTYRETHKKPPHFIQPVSQEGNSNVFLTSAQTDGIKLWDLRLQRCVRKFHHHPCNSARHDVSITSRGRYIATATDDKSICFYDTRREEIPVTSVATNCKTTSLSFTTDDSHLLTGNDQSCVTCISPKI